MLDYYRQQVQGTTIDANTLLSTDYFNLFNEVIMLLGLLPDMPEMLEEVDVWQFKTYAEHFESSGLAFAPLAIEAYPHSPEGTRESFERTIEMMRMTVEVARDDLHELAKGDLGEFGRRATEYATELQRLVETGSAIIHSEQTSLDQRAIDAFF